MRENGEDEFGTHLSSHEILCQSATERKRERHPGLCQGERERERIIGSCGDKFISPGKFGTSNTSTFK